jgi:hypothetical protein
MHGATLSSVEMESTDSGTYPNQIEQDQVCSPRALYTDPGASSSGEGEIVKSRPFIPIDMNWFQILDLGVRE